MGKKLFLFDEAKIDEELHISDGSGIKKTKIFFKDGDTGETIFTTKNKTIIHGSNHTAKCHFPELAIVNNTLSYNEALGLDNSNLNDDIFGDRIYLFSIGIDGCGVDQHQVKFVDYDRWCAPEHLVPFRYPRAGNDTVPRDLYFGRKDMSGINGRIAYYFKKFDASPQWVQRYISDKSPVNRDVYNAVRRDRIESFVELQLRVSKDDCREFYESTVGIEATKINTLSLLTAKEEIIDGNIYYQNIRPITKVNFPNETLFDINKALDVTYQLFY